MQSVLQSGDTTQHQSFKRIILMSKNSCTNLRHGLTFHNFVIIVHFVYIKLSEEVECNDSIKVDHNAGH